MNSRNLFYTPEMYIVSDDIAPALYRNRISSIVYNLDASFSTKLCQLIDATGKKNSEVYNRASIDRRLYFKIKNDKDYIPAKTTVLAFAIALELNLEQTDDILKRAGFALSDSREFDVIVKFYIQNRMYDIFEINEVLFQYGQPLLGGKAQDVPKPCALSKTSERKIA